MKAYGLNNKLISRIHNNRAVEPAEEDTKSINQTEQLSVNTLKVRTGGEEKKYARQRDGSLDC